MVSLTMMAPAARGGAARTARLVLVGDPDQLASVEAGAVLADLVGRLTTADASPVVALTDEPPLRPRDQARWPRRCAMGDADARARRAARRLGARSSSSRPTTPAPQLRADAARARRWPCAGPPRRGDAAAAIAGLDEHRLLCAHREGPYGVRHWNRQVERWLAERDRAARSRARVVRRPPAAGDQQRLRPRRSTTATPASWCRRPTAGFAPRSSRPRGPARLRARRGSTTSRRCTR